MVKAVKQVMLRGDLITLAGGLAVALATFYLAQEVVAFLIAPVISIFIGDSTFELNSFSIHGSEFRYGAVIEAALTLALVLAAVYFFVVPYRLRQGHKGVTAATHACPECTSSISVLAKRCPHCTAVVQPGSV